MEQAQVRALVVQHEDDVPLRMLGGWLDDEGFEVLILRPDRGDALPSEADLEAYDALVVLGGTMDSWDDAGHTWFPATRALLRAAGVTGLPALGICLGHQLAVQAYGGDVGRNPGGLTAGAVPVGWAYAAGEDPLLGAIAQERGEAAVAVHHNTDIALTLPDEARVLATAPDGTVQAVRFAPRVWGVQCHPEADAGLVRVWERVREGDPDPVVVAEVLAAEEALRATWRPLARALADLAHARRAERHSRLVDPAADAS